MQECEVILLKEPNAPEILAMLGDIETRLQAAGHAIASDRVEKWVDRRASTNGGSADRCRLDGSASTRRNAQTWQDRGDEHLAKFLVMQQLFTEDQVTQGARDGEASEQGSERASAGGFAAG